MVVSPDGFTAFATTWRFIRSVGSLKFLAHFLQVYSLLGLGCDSAGFMVVHAIKVTLTSRAIGLVEFPLSRSIFVKGKVRICEFVIHGVYVIVHRLGFIGNFGKSGYFFWVGAK
jgi:hypothetical protein